MVHRAVLYSRSDRLKEFLEKAAAPKRAPEAAAKPVRKTRLAAKPGFLPLATRFGVR